MNAGLRANLLRIHACFAVHDVAVEGVLRVKVGISWRGKDSFRVCFIIREKELSACRPI